MSDSTILHTGPADRDRASQATSTAASASPAKPAAGQGPNLYDRRFSIQVYDSAGKGLDLSALRCVFVVRQWEMATPNNMDLHITNLSAATASRMMKEFTRIQVSAGYEGQYGIIFDGTIVQARRGRDSPTDTYCHIVAADADQAHNQAVVNTTLAAGAKPEDVHKVVLSAFNQYGVEKGFTDPAMTGPALPRGRVLFGMARDTMRDVGRTTGTQWSIQNGRMQVTSRDTYAQDEAVVIKKETGMVGMPVIAPDGVMVRCLLNPLLRIGTKIKLDNNSIQQPRAGVDPKQGGNFVGDDGQAHEGAALQSFPKIEGDGTYKVLAVDHYGDTRGNAWYSEIEAIGVSQAGTQASAARGRGSWTDPNQPATPATPAPASTTAPTNSSGTDSRRDRDAYTSTSPAPLPATAVAAPPATTDTGGIVRNGHQIGY